MENSDLNLQEIYFKLKALIKLIFRNKLIITFILVLFIGVGRELRKGTKYEASTSIYVSSGKSGGIMSLAASFGVGSQNGITNDKISGVAQSEDVKNFVLRQQAIINGKNDFMINHFIDYLNLKNDWKETKKQLFNINFEEKGRLQDSLYIVLSRRLTGLIEVNQGPTGDVIISTTSKNEEFSLHLNRFILIYLRTFFKDLETAFDRKIITTLKSKRDSIQNEIIVLESKYALTSDKSINIVKSRGHITMKRIERQLFILNTVQSEIIKNLELTEYKYNSYSLPIKCINQPQFPLKKSRQSLLVNILISSTLGFLFAFIFIVLKHLFKKFENNI